MIKNPYHMDGHMFDGEVQYNGREGTYTNHFWNPSFVPVRAKYNDYGSVEDLDESNLHFKFWLKYLDSRLIEIPQGKNPYHDPPAKKGMTSEELFDVLQEGRLVLKPDHYSQDKSNIPVCQTMIREDVYQHLLSMQYKGQWWPRAETLSGQTIYDDAIKFYDSEEWKPWELKVKSLVEGWTPETLSDFHGLDMGRNVDNNYTEEFIGDSGEQLKTYKSYIAKRLCLEPSWKETQEFKDFLRDLCDWMYVGNMHDALRLTWHPGTGCGSQASNLAIASDFHVGMGKIARKVKKAQSY
jgi:hypothetical protein